jgi:hypothetical protein
LAKWGSPTPRNEWGSPKLKSSTARWGMRDRPFGPRVRLFQLLTTIRKISPKASVTMAR